MEEKRYKIGELAAIAKVSAKAIRIYEQKGILTSYRDERNQYRYFPESAVVSMQRIQMLKYLGFGLDDIKTMMQHYEQMNLAESFLEQKRMLEKKANELERMIYCMDRAARESQMEGFEIERLFDSLRHIILSRKADEGVSRMYGHCAEPEGWSRWIYDQAQIQPGAHILDAGCGWGNLWRFNEDRYVSDMDVTLVDFHNTHADGLAEFVQDKEQFHFLWGDLNELEFPGKYDCIFFNHVASYMEEPTATYSRLRSYLLPDGEFIATWGGFLLIEKLTELLCEYAPAERKKITDSTLEMKTELDQREEELKQVFGEIDLRKYPVNLYFESTGEMADYLEPFARKLGVNLADNMPRFESFLEERAGDRLPYTIARDAYLYVCREWKWMKI